MLVRSRRSLPTLPAAALLAAVATIAVPASALALQTSAYKTPADGKLKVQDVFEQTAGGSATVAKKGTELRGLKLTIGERTKDQCGEGTVTVGGGALKIKRVGSYKRPVVGKLNTKSKLIEPITATLTTPAGKVQGKVLVLFDKGGRTALSSKVEFGDCRLGFALQK